MSTPVEDYQDAFARIERAVQGGAADLGNLGFYRIVDRIKREPKLAAHWADVAGRIDRTAFERRVRPRFPVWVGNGVLLSGSAVLVAMVPVAVAVARDSATPEPFLAGALALVAGGGLGAALHDLGHWLVGRLGGIRFTSFFLDGPLRVQPGIKIDYATYLRASPGARAWMHASGALVTKVAPFAVFIAVYLPHRAAGYDLFPPWSLWGILGIGVVQLITDVAFSRKHSDWKKVRREVRIGRVQRTGV
ncbi:MAG: hypothetical protein ACRDH8_03010 [Actinomycetota bacterium]